MKRHVAIQTVKVATSTAPQIGNGIALSVQLHAVLVHAVLFRVSAMLPFQLHVVRVLAHVLAHLLASSVLREALYQFLLLLLRVLLLVLE